MSDEFEKRLKGVLAFLKEKQKWAFGLILFIILWLGTFIRTRNLPLMNWTWPGDVDSYVIWRYAEYYLQHGSLMALDTMRSVPLGFDPRPEFTFMSAFLAFLHRILDIFLSNWTMVKTDIVYPVICFVIGAIFFYLAVKHLFNEKVALLSTAFLVVVPTYLFRTMAGSSDKEALAMMFFFMAFYFFIKSWKTQIETHSLLWGSLAGLFTAFMAMTWGGAVYVFLIIGVFGFIEVLLKDFSRKDIYSYGSWIILTTIALLLFSNGRFNLTGLLVSFSTGIAYLVFFIGLINYLVMEKDLLKIKSKVIQKVPSSIFSVIAGLIIIAIITTIFFGPSFLYNQLSEVTSTMIHPLKDRWALTVAESHQPYSKDWFNQMGNTFTWAMLIASAVIFYQGVKKLKKDRYWLTGAYSLMILFCTFSRYSSDSTLLNGVSGTAKFMYIGSIFIFFALIITFYLRSFYKNKETFEELSSIDKKYIFALAWFIVMLFSARSAVRLIFVFSTATSLMVGYLGIFLFEHSLKIKNNIFKGIAIVLVSFLVISTFVDFTEGSLYNAKYMGPSYNTQWQRTGEWAVKNTPENAVFAHWWDYGYWVQQGFKRATITDGGNVIGPWNHYMGRHVLTGQSETEALTFLKPHNATHLLIVSDEIGKYPAFSSIGSDEKYDRYSWINSFNFEDKKVQETRDGTAYLYTGTFPLDEDFIYEGKLYPKQASGIIAFWVKTSTVKQEDKTGEVVTGASAIFVYNNEQKEIPLECVFVNGQELKFDVKGAKGCLMVIPRINGQTEINPIGSALYLSPRVRNTLFAKLYLFDQDSSNFKKVYSDQNTMPIATYNGVMIGPMKIWEISYPSSIKYEPVYLSTTYPNINVTII